MQGAEDVRHGGIPGGYTHGVQRLPDGRVRFRLWAPAVDEVKLCLDGGAVPMERQDGGWFEVLHECPAGTRYQFEPAGVGRVPDPASRLQLDDVDGPSVVINHGSYEWVNDGWRGRPWNEVVLYELHVGLLGGFDGVRQRLPGLARLGVTAVELMPIADFPGPRNWGYDGVLPYAPDRSYGSPEALKALIDEAHGLGLMVFLDVVYNHFGPIGNFLHAYAPQFFREDVRTPWGAAIDFRRPAVRSFFAENAFYWLDEYRFDGLRFDAVHAIVDKEEWLGELAVQLRGAFPPDRHIHLVLENDDNTASLLRHGYDAQWNDDVHHVVHHLLTGETRGYYAAYAGRPTDKLARALAQGFVYQGEPSPAHDGRPRGEPSSMLFPTSFIFFLQNHDQVGNRALGERLRVLCRTRPDALEAAVALQLLSPFIPLMFMGEELGAETPFLYFTSFSDPEFAALVRQGRRAEFSGFHEGEDLEVPDPNDGNTWRRSRLPPGDTPEARRWLAFYEELLSLRRRHLVPWLRNTTCDSVVVLGEGSLVASWTLGNGSRLTLYCNLSDERVSVVPGLNDARVPVLYESHPGSAASLHAGSLPARCLVARLLDAAPEAAEAEEPLGVRPNMSGGLE